ncbi:unnamed protein product [Caenorhabditis angaria]|uniref:Uncharacterized protein n=1 Tax=Caenorhabditis angaria TaxID=860376 RepID=A0A9P1ILC4_9PELO|nr:unnamed protein product [Caenorhabditis angaria]
MHEFFEHREMLLAFNLTASIEDGSISAFNAVFVLIIFVCLVSIFYYLLNICIDIRVSNLDTNMSKLHHTIYITCPIGCLTLIAQKTLLMLQNPAGFDPANQIFQILFILRFACVFPGQLCLSVFVIERSCATWFLADYETKSRSWIAFSIGSAIIFASLFMAWTLALTSDPIFHVAAIFALNIASCCGNLATFCVNKKAYEKCQRGSYSLAERFQISENIQFYFFFNRFAISIAFFALLCPILMFLHGRNFSQFSKNVIISLFELAVSCYTILTPYIVYKYNATWQAEFQKVLQKVIFFKKRVEVTNFSQELSKNSMGKSLRDTFGKEMNIGIGQQSETYFRQLTNTWDHV